MGLSSLIYGLSRPAWFFLLSSIGLVALCLAVDRFLATFTINIVLPRIIIRLITDSTTHALIGGWCWFNIWLLRADEDWSRLKLTQVLTCAAMASLLDVDHILEAPNLSIKAAMNLSHRPFLHNTFLILLIAAVLYLLVYLSSPWLRNSLFIKDFPTMFLVTGTSHHLRDADRRGLWFAPFGSTPPLPYKLYVFGLVLLPIVTSVFGLKLRRQMDVGEAVVERMRKSTAVSSV